MELKFINEIKKLESPPKVIKLFSSKEIKQLQDFYKSLPVTVHNKKQNVIKKRWIQNHNKDLDQLYVSKLKEVLGDFKMDNLKSDNGEDFFGLLQERFSVLLFSQYFSYPYGSLLMPGSPSMTLRVTMGSR